MQMPGRGGGNMLPGIAFNKCVEIHPILCFNMYIFSSIYPFLSYFTTPTVGCKINFPQEGFANGVLLLSYSLIV